MHWVQTLENRLAVEVESKLGKQTGMMCFVGNSAEIITTFYVYTCYMCIHKKLGTRSNARAFN
jgi:hypothetical protein